MSLFDKNKTPEKTATDDNRLREWGDAERNEPPARRGSFAAIVNRLTRQFPATAPEKPVSWLRPIFAMGLATCVTMSVAVQMMDEQKARVAEKEAVEMAQTVRQRQNAVRYLANRKREVAKPIIIRDAVWTDRGLVNLGNGIAARCSPVFVEAGNPGITTGKRDTATTPISVTIKNTGAAFSGIIEVASSGSNTGDRTYEYPVTIAGNGATFHQTLYPEMANLWQNDRYEVRLRKPGQTIRLDVGTVRRTGYDDSGSTYRGNVNKVVAILDKRIGVLSPRFNGGSDRGYGALYAKPQYAPDRAIGYDAVDTLILGYGCERLSAAQWSAIREWVKDGGSLVMLGGSPEMRRVLATPTALELSPALSFAAETRTTTPRLRVSHFDISPLQNGYFSYDHDITEHFPMVMTTAPRLKTDAKIIFQSPMRGQDDWATVSARRTLGAGSVAFYGFDPTVDVYRGEPASLTKWWNDVSQYDKGALPAARMNGAATKSWGEFDHKTGRFRPDSHQEISRDPFYTQFPALPTVMYVFLGYFVLVVPVSFVVLKQTRRMNYAWFTAPALAALCAGGLSLTTRSLYDAPQAVRTSGVLALEAGDPVARFHGVSELYTPKAGRYTINVPGAGQTFGSGTDYDGNLSDYAPIRNTVDAGTGENPPVLEMGNLSFKRLYHGQTVTLGSGITLSLRATPDGSLKGELRNGTGQTLRNVVVQMRGENTVFRHGATHIPVWRCAIAEIIPGSRTIVLSPRMYSKNGRQDGTMNIFGDKYETLMPRTPFLTAEMNGKPFAPQGFGEWAGGDHSVTVVAKLPAVPERAMPILETDPFKTSVFDQYKPVTNWSGFDAPPGFYHAPVAPQGDN